MKDLAGSLVMATSLLVGLRAPAQQQNFTVDPKASQVAFSLNGNGHRVIGTFQVASGTVEFDRTTRSITGLIVVAAASGSSGDASRDTKMNNQVLDVKRYTEITFLPQRYDGQIAPIGDSSIQVSGTFTLHGTPHDLSVPMQIHIYGAALTASAHFAVPYVRWGLKDPSVFVLKVAKDVVIDLTLTGKLGPAS